MESGTPGAEKRLIKINRILQHVPVCEHEEHSTIIWMSEEEENSLPFYSGLTLMLFRKPFQFACAAVGGPLNPIFSNTGPLFGRRELITFDS